MLAIAVSQANRLQPVGTGFLIGPSIAFTAAHTIDEDIDSVVAFQVVNRGEVPLMWDVMAMYRSPSAADRDDLPLDITLLKLNPRGEHIAAIEKHRGLFFEMNVATPQVGQKIAAYGFSKAQIQADPNDPMLFELSHAFRRVEGRVIDVRWPHRDFGQLPFPCFAVDAEFESGMSGGPILNEKGQVCGVVSTGGMSGISWASILWPALGIRLPGGGYLLDHARSLKILARNHQCVSLHPNEEGGIFPKIMFDPSLELP